MVYMRHLVSMPDTPTGKKKPYFRAPKRCQVCQATSSKRFCADCAYLVSIAKWSKSAYAILEERFKPDENLST